MAGISHKSLEAWIAIAQGKWPERPATPWHKRLLKEVRQAEASPLVLMQAKAVARGDVRYMLMRWPGEFSRPDEVAPVVPNRVQENVITIPAERVPEFARFLARADLPQITDASGRIVDPLAGLEHIEE